MDSSSVSPGFLVAKEKQLKNMNQLTHTIPGTWTGIYIYIHLADVYGFHAGKYTIVPWMRHG